MKKHMPLDMRDKVIITNTTTADNVDMLRERGVARIITTTPRYDGRSFGTGIFEMITESAPKGHMRRL